jgi:hypothetical protein
MSWFVSAARTSPFPRLDCTHEEADRMMFHVQDIYVTNLVPLQLRSPRVIQMFSYASCTTLLSTGNILVLMNYGLYAILA